MGSCSDVNGFGASSGGMEGGGCWGVALGGNTQSEGTPVQGGGGSRVMLSNMLGA